jgi:spermidine/putrescine transport system permease protein
MATFGARFDRWRRTDEAGGLLLVSPTLIYSVLLLAAPLALIVAYSFWTQVTPTTIDHSFTLENYRKAWTDQIYQTLFLRSVWISASVTAVTVVLAFPVAYYVSFHVAPAKKSMWIFLITIPFWTSYLIRVFLWKVILGYNGVVNSSLMFLGVTDAPLQAINYNLGAVVLTLAHAYAPFAILPIFVALEKIDRSLLEAGQDLGESRFTTFLRVTLPLAMPGVVASVLIVFIPTIGDYVTPRLVGGPNGNMISNMIHLTFMKIGDKPLGSALAMTAMLIVTAVSLGFLWLTRRWLKAR